MVLENHSSSVRMYSDPKRTTVSESGAECSLLGCFLSGKRGCKLLRNSIPTKSLIERYFSYYFLKQFVSLNVHDENLTGELPSFLHPRNFSKPVLLPSKGDSSASLGLNSLTSYS